MTHHQASSDPAVTIRRASVHDVPAVGKIINDCAEYGLMLHRSLSFLYEHVREFHVAVGGGGVLGVCGLSIVWANLAEVFSLAVVPERRGQGIGKRLVLACVDEARQLGIRKLMTLTYEPGFFRSCGFGTVDRQQLPLKVWSDCVRCSKNQACDEVAMIRVLEDVPDAGVGVNPEHPAEGSYEVPVTLGIIQPQRLDQREKMDEAH